MNTVPFKYHVTAFASNGTDNGVNLGTAVDLTSGALIEHVLSVYDRTSGVDLAVFPYDEAGSHAVREDGTLYPIYTYRSGRESMRSREYIAEQLHAYVGTKQKQVAKAA